MKHIRAVQLWNGLTSESVTDSTDNISKFGAAVLASGANLFVRSGNGEVAKEEQKAAVEFLRGWADAIENSGDN